VYVKVDGKPLVAYLFREMPFPSVHNDCCFIESVKSDKKEREYEYEGHHRQESLFKKQSKVEPAIASFVSRPKFLLCLYCALVVIKELK
jgi:hypothetical protein